MLGIGFYCCGLVTVGGGGGGGEGVDDDVGHKNDADFVMVVS